MTRLYDGANPSGPAAAAGPMRLDRSMIEAAIRSNCFLGQYGDVPAVNGVTVAADAIWSMHCADLALATEGTTR